MTDAWPSGDELQQRLRALLPRASAWDRHWVESNSLGENVLRLAESLTQVLPLRAGMRVLDLGCGRAVSSIFMAREYGVVPGEFGRRLGTFRMVAMRSGVPVHLEDEDGDVPY